MALEHRRPQGDDRGLVGVEMLNNAISRDTHARSRMVRPLLTHFGTTRTRFVTLRDDRRHLAQAAVEPIGKGQWRIFCPGQAPIALMVYDHQVADRGLWPLRRVLRRLPGLGLALHIPYQDGPFSWLAGVQSRVVDRALVGTTVAIRPAGSFDEYWSARPKELRDNIRRRTRRVADEGLKATLDCTDDPAKIGDAVDRYGELESRGWKGHEGTALHPTNRQGRFYRELLEAFARSGEGRVYELRLDERLVASRLVISGPSMHVVLKTTHDEELRRYAPGHVQLHGVLRDLLSKPGGRSVELYTNAGRDWVLWSTHTREIMDFTLYRNSLLLSRLRGGDEHRPRSSRRRIHRPSDHHANLCA